MLQVSCIVNLTETTTLSIRGSSTRAYSTVKPTRIQAIKITGAGGSGGGGATYTAGNGLTLANNEFSVDTTVVAQQSDIPTAVSELTNDSGFITSETDPVFSASAASGITQTNIDD